MWVIDSSIFMALVLPDEKNALADRFFDSLGRRDRLWVPSLWWYEVANVLTIAQRRNRISEAEAMHVLERIDGLPLDTDGSIGTESAERQWRIARQHGLSAYDAAYLELAERRSAGLASLDEKLRDAARRAGLSVAA